MEIKRSAKKIFFFALVFVMVLSMATSFTAYGATKTITKTETIAIAVSEANHSSLYSGVRKAGVEPFTKNYGNNTTQACLQVNLGQLKSFMSSHQGAKIKKAELHFSALGCGNATTSRRLQLHELKTEPTAAALRNNGNPIKWQKRPLTGARISGSDKVYVCVNKGATRTINWDVCQYLNKRYTAGSDTITFGFALTQQDNKKQVNLLNVKDPAKTYLKVVVEYQEPVERVLEGIVITTPPTDTEYVEGQTFNPAGMVVEAIYNDGTREVVTDYQVTSSPLTVSDERVEINYQGKVVYQGITVAKRVLDKIEITTPPTKTEYVIGQTFSPAGMVVEAIYNDGTREVVTDYKVTTAPLTASDKQVEISYQGKTTYQEIYVGAWQMNVRIEGDYLIFDAYENDGQYLEDYLLMLFEEDVETVQTDSNALPVMGGHVSYDSQNVGIVKIHLGQLFENNMDAFKTQSIAIMAIDFKGADLGDDFTIGDASEYAATTSIAEIGLAVNYKNPVTASAYAQIIPAELITPDQDGLWFWVVREDGKCFEEGETVRIRRYHYAINDIDGDGGYVYNSPDAPDKPTGYEYDLYMTNILSDAEDRIEKVDGELVAIKLSENEAMWLTENKEKLSIADVGIWGYYGLNDSLLELETLKVENIDSKTAVCTITNLTPYGGWIIVPEIWLFS